MPRPHRSRVPAFVAAVLVLGLATPAYADVAPRNRERETRTLEPHSPPPMKGPPEQPPAELAEQPPAELAEQPPSEEPPAAEPAKPAESPNEPKTDDAKAESKTSSCSIDEHPERGLLGVAGLILLISGASLRRRRA